MSRFFRPGSPEGPPPNNLDLQGRLFFRPGSPEGPPPNNLDLQGRLFVRPKTPPNSKSQTKKSNSPTSPLRTTVKKRSSKSPPNSPPKQLSPLPQEDLTLQYLTRLPSDTISNQRDDETCASHTYARIFSKAIRNFVPVMKQLEGKNCNEYYDISNMPYLLTHNFQRNKKAGTKSRKPTILIDNWKHFQNCSTGNQFNLVIYIFIYKIIKGIYDDRTTHMHITALHSDIIATFTLIKTLTDLSILPMQQLKEIIKEIMTGFFIYTERNAFGGLSYGKPYNKKTIARFNYVCNMIANVLNEFFENVHKKGNNFNMIVLFNGIRVALPDPNELYMNIKTIISKGYYLFLGINTEDGGHAMVIYDIKKMHELRDIDLSFGKKLKDDDIILVLKNSWGDTTSNITFIMKNGYVYVPLNKLRYKDLIFCILPTNGGSPALDWVIRHYSITNIPQYKTILTRILTDIKYNDRIGHP